MSSNELSRPMFIFDADCGVCQNSTQLMEKRINPPVDFRPYQSIDYTSYGITTKNLSEGPILISTDATFLVGPLGMATLLKMSRRPYSYMGRFMLLPGIRHFLKKVGPTLYEKRRFLPGATDSCAINPQ